MKLTTKPSIIGTVAELYPEVPSYLGFMSVYRVDDTNYVDTTVSKFLVTKWLSKESVTYTLLSDNKTEIELIAVQDSENQPTQVVPPSCHFGIIRANYTSVEWVMKNGGGWSLSAKFCNRANFISLKHATEVLENICRLYHWGNECLTVVPLAKHSVTGQLPPPSPTPAYDEGTTFVVLREAAVHQDGYSVCVAEYLADDSGGWRLTEDLDERYEFDSFEEAQQAIQGDNYLVVVPIAPKPLSPAAIASAKNLVSELLRVNKDDEPDPSNRPCLCGSGKPYKRCNAFDPACG